MITVENALQAIERLQGLHRHLRKHQPDDGEKTKDMCEIIGIEPEAFSVLAAYCQGYFDIALEKGYPIQGSFSVAVWIALLAADESSNA